VARLGQDPWSGAIQRRQRSLGLHRRGEGATNQLDLDAESSYKTEGVVREKGGKSAALINSPLDLGSTAVGKKRAVG
jgi:hypothetical protein